VNARALACAAAVVALASSGAADAHIVAARLGDFYTGAMHPLTDLQDVVLWIALGIFAGSVGPERGRWLVPVVPLGLLTGLAIELGLGVGALGPLGNAALMVCLGLLLVAGVRADTWLLCTIAFGLAVVRGAVNATGVVPATNVPLFAAGLATSGYAAITLIMALVVWFHRSAAEGRTGWRHIAVRVCGSWIAAVGLMIAGLALKAGAA
jgi:urease accessory protein